MLTEQTPDEVSAAPDHEPTEQAGGHHFRLNEAAQSCGVSRSTMRRKRESGAFPNAYTDSAGAWIIPLADLLGLDSHQARAGPSMLPKPRQPPPPSRPKIAALSSQTRR